MAEECKIFEGIIVGTAGGAAAGLIILFIQYIKIKCIECCHKKRIYQWLQKNTADKDNKRFRTTRSIASWNNLTEDRVRYICSIDDKIYLSMGEK
ncbi:MAG: hypothetical protein AUJ12_05295 [Alphaproteobacteria bacterium CG1_02_46_17]|nr:MAG: hypothetical protein AUJ12_05295 [Alphaproteobacteria bacterium CG1_02_46_17]